ncbi:hypothetical protein PC116_g26331 [Phytophthora cactorum]|uniref:Uncharacterized protein n=1 Tax=Phytophthora cactorum TaxID=29920 RepID=A0A8T1JQ51_9STRA|nr:hypothetical protein PC111_g21741 [Phytophthora cactorum]KAG2796758.1 hypothetical protein PC112_g22070 [Phytophthora cactorum]KAG2875645.1 hypothetical protein PC114_g24605 [Phytophthora cactorum]KAG2882507.1 hypothetical protein PC115_g21926 [Phytophthora cactorum]KAG3053829.1 hypothetical protein PC122_g22215 [Phytophthora cactorum]
MKLTAIALLASVSAANTMAVTNLVRRGLSVD